MTSINQTNKNDEIIKEGEFGRAYFRDIYFGINNKWYRKSRKEFVELKNIDQNYYYSNYYAVSINKYGVKCGTSLRFWENKDWINPINPYGWFQWYISYWLGRRSLGDERQIDRWKEILNRFKGKLIKMTKGGNRRTDEHSISAKIRQILLHWGYKLVESDFLWFIIFLFI